VSLAQVLASGHRRVRWALAPGWRVRRALAWERADQRDRAWWPQGITCSADAGRADRLLLVSWYSKQGGGARITFLDRVTRHYVHVPLALPRASGPVPLAVHAGGLLWRGPWLYVAATGRGCYVAHLDDLRRRPDGELVWPVRLHYAAEDGMRYSFLSVTDEDELLAGEYGRGEQTTRLVRFRLDASGLLALDADRVAHAVGVDVGVRQMQGAVRRGDRYLATVSHGSRRLGSLYVGRSGALQRHRFATPVGPEDLTWSDGLLWSVSEHPGRRRIFALRPPNVR
jgi:hypothetical protein